MWRVPALSVCLLLSGTLVYAGSADVPSVVIYAPGAPAYANYLSSLLEEDGIEAEVQILTAPDDFNLVMHHPRVKVAVVALNTNVNHDIGITLEWFFREGGGLIGLGFAGSGPSTGRASEEVFPIFANAYRNGEFDPVSRGFKLTHLSREVDPISEGIGDFTVLDSKLILNLDPSSKEFVRDEPSSGDYEVLYVDSVLGAPTVVKFENGGVSVTFAGYAADDSPGSFGYYGKFAESSQFRSLFVNAFRWVWDNERRQDASMEFAALYPDREQEVDDLRRQAEERESRRATARLVQMALTISIAGAAVLGIYWATFLKAP